MARRKSPWCARKVNRAGDGPPRLPGTPIPMIDLENVTKRYGTKTAVDRLNLKVGRGELFAFLGPNGAGKTTTLKMMCGLLFPTEGRIRIGGHDLQTEGQAARQLLS